MSDVEETLQELSHRRLRELMGAKHQAASLRRLHMTLPMNKVGKPLISYETLRQIHTGVHSGNISDETADALALMWKVDIETVLRAAGQRPRLGAFELPTRAQRLTQKERRLVLGVIDAILNAADEEASMEVGAREEWGAGLDERGRAAYEDYWRRKGQDDTRRRHAAPGADDEDVPDESAEDPWAAG